MIFLRQFFYSAGLFATVLLCWLPAMAKTSSAQAAKPDTISGRVVNESGRPLRNAHVTLRRLGSMGPESINTTTDGEGNFDLHGLKPVNYQVFAYLQGYTQLLPALDDTQAGVYRPGNSVTLVMTKGGVITGRVTNQAGEPLVGVNVRAQMVANQLPVANHLLFSYSPFAMTDLTDDRGIYRVYGLPEGTYVVWAGGGRDFRSSTDVDPFEGDVPTYAPASTRDTAQTFMVRAGAELNGVNIQYRGGSGHAVSGSARGPEGNQPLPFGIFIASASGPHWLTRAAQGPDDRSFIFHGVDDGWITLRDTSREHDAAPTS